MNRWIYIYVRVLQVCYTCEKPSMYPNIMHRHVYKALLQSWEVFTANITVSLCILWVWNWVHTIVPLIVSLLYGFSYISLICEHPDWIVSMHPYAANHSAVTTRIHVSDTSVIVHAVAEYRYLSPASFLCHKNTVRLWRCILLWQESHLDAA